MAITVDPTSTRNTHHIKLTDADSTEVGFITTDAIGDKKPQVSVSPYPTMASQLRQGRGKHADRVPPFEDIVLSDFTGGLGFRHHDEDSTVYNQGYMCNTSVAGRVLLAGQPVYTDELRGFDEFVPAGSATETRTWKTMHDGTTAQENTNWRFTAQASYSADKAFLQLRTVGSPTGDITFTIKDSDGQNSYSATASAATGVSSHSPYWVEFDWTGTKSITSGQTYLIEIDYASGDSSNYIQVWADYVAGDINSETYHFAFRIIDNQDTDKIYIAHLFEYKRGIYCVENDYTNNQAKLYLLGYRGVCASNTGNLNYLYDDDASWTNDYWNNDYVYIIGGSGSLEQKTWRRITDTTSDKIYTTGDNWVIDHTTSTEYVIYSHIWSEWQTLSEPVTDVAVIGDKVYFCYGNAEDGTTFRVERYREYNNGGTWTKQLEDDETLTIGAVCALGISRDTEASEQFIDADLYFARQGKDGTLYLDKYQNSRYWTDKFVILGELLPNDHAWADTLYSNTDVSMDIYGGKCAVGASFTTGKCAHWKLDSPVNVLKGQSLMVSGLVDATAGNYTTAGDIRLVLADSDGNEDEYNFDGTMDTAYAQFMDLTATSSANADMTDITDVYLKINSYEGAVDIYIYGPIYIVGDEGEPFTRFMGFGENETPNNLIEYGGGAGSTQARPWFFTDAGVYYIEDGQIKKLYLRELSVFAHPDNGKAAAVNDVYLYFNLGDTIQRYYAGHLDMVFPPGDVGLPSAQTGVPSAMASYPGMVLAAINAGKEGSTYYSSVVARRNHGWMELYRSMEDNIEIKDILVQARADRVDRLYIAEGGDVLYIPLSLNPEEDRYSYYFAPHGHVVTARIYGGLRETEKYFNALTVIQSPSRWGTSGGKIRVYYRTSDIWDGTIDTWTLLDNDYDTESESADLVSTNDTEGKWIDFLFELESNEETETPIMYAAVLDALERLDSANTYTYNIRLKEGYDHNLLGQKETQTGKDKWDQIQTWVDDPKPLTLESTSAFEDGKLVFIEPERCRVLYSKVDDKGQEVRIYQLTLIEVA